MRTLGPRRLVAWGGAVATVGATVVGCGSVPGTPHPAPTTVAPPPSGPVTLSGWKLTLPVLGGKGHAATVDPAVPTPPWLVPERDGGLTLWAPVAGSTTPHSRHTRTELDSLTSFHAGVGRHLLSASVTVTQLPRAKPDVILGQIHGADALSSVPFVMLHDDGGQVVVVVKQTRTGPDSARLPLLTDVPLGARFDFTIADNGDGSVTFTATRDGRTATAGTAVPAAFRGASVRFQAGAYQQADSTGGRGASDDGARITFHSLLVGP